MPQDSQLSGAAPAPQPLRPAQRPRPGSGVVRSYASLRCISALTLREMATRYANSPGGYAWALFEPLGAILIMAAAFSLLVRTPPLGNSFILFFATGFLPFSMFGTISGMIAGCIGFSRPLLQYPAVTWVDAMLARFFLNALTGILVTLVLMSMLIYITDTPVMIEIVPIVQAMTLVMLIGAGVGVLNCVLFGLFPIWQRAWGIMTRPLVLASGVIFIYEGLPPAVQAIVWYNPLMHLTGLMRTGFFPTYRPDYIDLTYVIIFGLVPLFLGLVLMGRYHRDILSN